MKNKLIVRMFVILIINVFAVAASVYGIGYVISRNAMMDDIRERADGVKDFILENLEAEDFIDIGEESEAGLKASLKVQKILNQLQGVGSLSRLYIAKVNESNRIVTTMMQGEDKTYVPTGKLEADLRLSLDEVEAVLGKGIYRTDSGSVYTIFWPVSDSGLVPLGVVCMEFDVGIIIESNRQTAIYSLALSGSLILLFCIISYLALSRASEPFYKKLAYTDFLTGYENRMAFEHRLRECHGIADRGEKVTLIICDVNLLKTVNDVQGHKAGDAYLKATADIIVKNLRKFGPLYRIGGDEFASIIVGKREKEIQTLMEALRDEKSMTIKNQPFSCACGAATFTKGIDQNLRDVFKRADEAMYAEKKRQKAEMGIPMR